MFLFSCANKKDPDQHMQLLNLISIIDDSCIDKEVLLAKFLILDSQILHIDEQSGLGHIPQIIYHRLNCDSNI